MRASVIWSLVLVAAVLVASGCNGTSKRRSTLEDSCKRQVSQIKEEASESTIKEAKSSQDATAKEHLVECAGQPVETTPAADAAATGDGAEADAGGAPAKLTAAQMTAERATFEKTCASCHTLADAKATGTFGPDLDKLELTADAITNQLKNGGGGMPAGLLTGDDADAMANYILSVQPSK